MKSQARGLCICETVCEDFFTEGVGCLEAPFFIGRLLENPKKYGVAKIISALFCEKVLTFDKSLYIRGIEENSCFICVRVLWHLIELNQRN